MLKNRMKCSESISIAALFVDKKGVYSDVSYVDVWDVHRDARLYEGPFPVVAHPPCARWCRLAGLVEARWGYKRGDDKGCFASALMSVRTYGGVLEHPAYSMAFKFFSLPTPSKDGGWSPPDEFGGRSCYVEQGRYGHVAKKATWLYSVKTSFAPLKWGHVPDQHTTSNVVWCRNKKTDSRPRVGRANAAKTPILFRDELLALVSDSFLHVEKSSD